MADYIEPVQIPGAETCNWWPGTDLLEAVLCGAPAVIRQGMRCTNGCWGEGVFDYVCKTHIEYASVRDGDPDVWVCVRCNEYTIETFPIQYLNNSEAT